MLAFCRLCDDLNDQIVGKRAKMIRNHFSQDLATMTQSKTLLAKADWSTSKVPAAVASTSSTESLPFAIPIGDRRHSTVCTTHACSESARPRAVPQYIGGES